MKYVNIHIFSQLTWLSQTNCGWWRKTTYTFEFSVKSSIRIRYFSSCAKKKLNFVDQCYWTIAVVWFQSITQNTSTFKGIWLTYPLLIPQQVLLSLLCVGLGISSEQILRPTISVTRWFPSISTKPALKLTGMFTNL